MTLEGLSALVTAMMSQHGHYDDLLHRIDQRVAEMHEVFAEHRHLISRAAVLADPAASVRDTVRALTGRGAKAGRAGRAAG